MGQIENCLDDILEVLKAGGGGGGRISVVPLWAGANGTYTAPSGTAYSPVTVDVVAGGKLPQVVDNTATEITEADLAGAGIIRDYAFAHCTNLRSVTIPSGVTSIGTGAFATCPSLTNIVIPSGVTSIGIGAFQSCTNLISVTIPLGVTLIADSTFIYCSKLASVTIPSGVTSIGQCAFGTCTSLTGITIPSSVTSIGKNAFSYNSNLKSVTVEAATPPAIDIGVFQHTRADLVIYVPAESVSAYQSATNWSTYASKIQAIPNS